MVRDEMLRVYSVYAGSKFPIDYVFRLQKMLAKNLALPHQFCLLTDQAAAFKGHETIKAVPLRPCQEGGFFNKLQLFDPAMTGDEPFLYLDITLVVLRSLEPLVHHGSNSSASLIAVDDWNWPNLNSCVMWIKPGEETQSIWQLWSQGERFGREFPGDQNYIDFVMNERFVDRLGYWPEEYIASYKVLRKLSVVDQARAEQQLRKALILKFHGMPRPPDVLNPLRHPWSTIFRHPFCPRVWRFLHKEIRESWIGDWG